MAPLTKDTLEAANTTSEAAVPKIGAPAKSAQSGNSVRADAVSLEIPVNVHGSKVTEVVRDVTPHTEPFEEQTATMIVFPQGGVLRMSTSVSVGQMLVVTNLKSRQDAICRVVKVRTFSNLQGYVEVEFTHPQPGYWGVYFPSDASPRANKTVPSAAPVAAEPSAMEKPAAPVSSAQDVSWAPAAAAKSATQKPLDANPFASDAKLAPAAPVPAAPVGKPETTFISIGSQEKVQPAASATVTTKPAAPVKSQPESQREPAVELPKPISVFNFPAAPPAPAPPSLSMDELRGDAASNNPLASLEASSAAESDSAAPEEPSPRTDRAGSTFGSLSGGASLGTSRSASPELFAAGVLSASDASADHPAPRQNGMLIGVCLLVLFGGVAAGIFYFRNYVNAPAVNTRPVVVSQPAPAQIAPAAAASAAPLAPRTKANSAPANAVTGVTPAPETNPSAAARPPATADANTPPTSATTQPSAPTKRSASSVTSKMMGGTLAAHPVSSQRAASNDADADAAPSVDAAPAGASDGAMPGIMGSSRVAAPPEPDIRPQGPVVVGGNVREPRLVYYAPPVYPVAAQEANVQGDVVVKTTVDEGGHVTHMDVVSGPTMLRQPAIEALKRWRYEPSKLNGQPIAIQMLVIIKFHH
jgi:TonB family protein